MWDLTGWLTKGKCDVSLLDDVVGFVGVCVVFALVIVVASAFEKFRGKK